MLNATMEEMTNAAYSAPSANSTFRW
jgi:hypothetical protein